jgi:hypothetical protein
VINRLSRLSSYLEEKHLSRESSLVLSMLSELKKKAIKRTASAEYWDFHINNVPSGWSSSNFSPEDLMSKGNKRVKIYRPALQALNEVASKQPSGKPVRLTNQNDSSKNGAYRDKVYNSKVGGASGSHHVHGKAFDIDVSEYNEEERLILLKALVDAGFIGFGHGRSVIHADMGRKRYWAYAGYKKPEEKAYRGGSGSPSDLESVPIESGEDRGCDISLDDESLLSDVRSGGKLRPGTKGPAVGLVQTMLEEHGYAFPNGGIDCSFGSETKANVKDFQSTYGLRETGLVDKSTLVILEHTQAARSFEDDLAYTEGDYA